jgi:hypothetical protein
MSERIEFCTKHTSSCLKNAADDEPIFVLRAQDYSAPEVIKEWIRCNPQIGPEKRHKAEGTIIAMLTWRTRKEAD